MQMLLDLHRRFGIGILVIEHDIETITSLCQRVCVLNFGKLIADGAPQAVFDDPEVIKSYTGDSGA
jgi:branched-chain amino acid transport system ATP-binding protein